MPFQKRASKSSILNIYHFQNLPATNVPFSCEREAYPSNFSPFSKLSLLLSISLPLDNSKNS